jgi:hypothetical protein
LLIESADIREVKLSAKYPVRELEIKLNVNGKIELTA